MDSNSNIPEVQRSERSAENNSSAVKVYPLPENWKTFICTQDNLSLVWEKLNLFPILFDDDVRGNFQRFIQDMTNKNSIIFLTGDYGICEFCNIVPYRDCDVHLTFWDKRFRGRHSECEMALKWLFNTLQLHRTTISVVAMAYSTINFIKSLGFIREGVIRERFPYKGRLLDIHLFGILKSEVFKEEEVKDG